MRDELKEVFELVIDGDIIILSKNKTVKLETFLSFFSEAKSSKHKDLYKLSEDKEYGYEDFFNECKEKGILN